MRTYHHADLTERIIGCALAVHSVLGPGLLENAYHRCLAAEFRFQEIPFKSEVPIPIIYRDEIIPIAYRMDFVLYDRIILELKAVDSVSPFVTAQILTYLKLTNLDIALLVNFNATPLRSGIKRFLNKSI